MNSVLQNNPLQVYLIGKVNGNKWKAVKPISDDYKFISSDGNNHSEHDWGIPRSYDISDIGNPDHRSFVLEYSLTPLTQSDAVVAYLDRPDCFGSIAELGYWVSFKMTQLSQGMLYKSIENRTLIVFKNNIPTENLTPNGSQVYEIVSRCCGQITTDEIYQEVKEIPINIDRRYLSKILYELGQKGLIKKVKHGVYESNWQVGPMYDAYWFIGNFPLVTVKIVSSIEEATKVINSFLYRLSYHGYLDSEEWKEKRKEALKKANNRCVLCNSTNNLQVHHRTYENVGDEKQNDLTVLCRECHSKFHEVAA